MSWMLKRRSARRLTVAAACALVTAAAIAVRAQQNTPAPAVPQNYAPHPAPEQPLPYSHRTHLALGLTCNTCHIGGQTTAQMGFPEARACMTCHAAIAADKPSIQKLAGFASSGEVIPWARVYEILPGITWSHQPHLAAGVACGACHGQVAELEAMSMTTSVTAMASCIGCHEARAANTACTTCHAWPAAQTAAR